MEELCNHIVLGFGSGDYYIICEDCNRFWSIEPNPAKPYINNNLLTANNEKRVSLDEMKKAVSWRFLWKNKNI